MPEPAHHDDHQKRKHCCCCACYPEDKAKLDAAAATVERHRLAAILCSFCEEGRERLWDDHYGDVVHRPKSHDNECYECEAGAILTEADTVGRATSPDADE